MDHIVDCLLVSFDFSSEDTGVLIVAKKKPKLQDVEIINAFQGQEAYELYKKLTTRKNEAD